MMLPKKYSSISKQDLLRKYTEELWEQKLAHYHCECIELPRKTTRIWKDGQLIMAVITWHRNPDGEQMVVRSLRDGDTMFDIDHTPPGPKESPVLSTSAEKR